MRLVALTLMVSCLWTWVAQAQDNSPHFSVEEGTFQPDQDALDVGEYDKSPLITTGSSYQASYQHAPRFHMIQNGRVQTADDFDLWLKRQGLTIGKAKSLPSPRHLSEQATPLNTFPNPASEATQQLDVKQGTIVKFNPL